MQTQRYRTVVKRHHVRRREIQVVVAGLAMAIVLATGFYFGQRAAYSGMGISPASYREMKAAMPLKEQQIEELEHTLDVSRTRSEVDRAALEMVRREIAAHKKQVMDLEESLRFYQGLMAPEELARGLILRPVELIATSAENRFAFRIVALQEARKHSLLKGTLSVTVEGVVGDEELSFPLSALSDDIKDGNLVLRFRYFQAIEGELVLPPDFQPGGISMVANTSAPQKVEVREFFPWSVQEKFSYAGK
jgi:hypothetical protein